MEILDPAPGQAGVPIFPPFHYLDRELQSQLAMILPGVRKMDLRYMVAYIPPQGKQACP
jgi:hypothetical protein